MSTHRADPLVSKGRGARSRRSRGALGTAFGIALLAAGCLAPPPPIVVETPFGDVRAENERTAAEVADLLEGLAPKVQDLLPGSQDRAVDVWVQEELRVHRFHKRPESVRGFTLLSGEFDARRIHLQEDGHSPWYLGHELVHALIGKSWAPLPGILEEGLADTIAEHLAPRYRLNIRAHRLLNATAFGHGVELTVIYRDPELGRGRDMMQSRVHLQLSPAVPIETARELLAAPRSELHARWSEIPEAFYGFSWLVVSRIAERHGIAGLHELCADAVAAGEELVPVDRLLAAAELDLEKVDPAFIASCFDARELQQAAHLRPCAFARAALEALRPLRGRVTSRELFTLARPAFLLEDGTQVPISAIDPVREALRRSWRVPPPTTLAQAADDPDAPLGTQ